jgi:hypothetical protein
MGGVPPLCSELHAATAAVAITLAKRCSVAGLDASVHDNALPVRHVLDGDYTKPLGKLEGGSSFGSADVGALSDPCQWQRASPGSLGIVADDGKDGHRFHLQMFGY